MTRKIEEYKLGDLVEVGRYHESEVIDWRRGYVVEIKHGRPLSAGTTTILVTVQLVPGGITLVYADRDAKLVRYPTDACPIGSEVEIDLPITPGWSGRGRVTGAKPNEGYFIIDNGGNRSFWPPERVRLLPEKKPDGRNVDDLAKALDNVQAELEATRQQLLRKVRDAEDAAKDANKYHGELVKLRVENARLSGVEGAIEGWRERASKAEAELAKVKAAHADTTKAHFENAYNVGIARSERDDALATIDRMRKHEVNLREELTNMTKRVAALATRASDAEQAVAECAKVNIAAIDQIQAAIKRAETAEKALAERANLHGLRHEDIEAVEAMWRRKFEALEKKLAYAEECRDAYHKQAQAAETRISNARAKLEG